MSGDNSSSRYTICQPKANLQMSVIGSSLVAILRMSTFSVTKLHGHHNTAKRMALNVAMHVPSVQPLEISF